MAKKKNKKQKVDEQVENLKPIEIMKAKLRDGFCDYSYEIKQGTGVGFTHGVKGEGLYMTDLGLAFQKLHVHLAIMDEAFKYKEIEVENISSVEDHEIVDNYRVQEVKFKGTRENLSVIIIGTKYSMTAGEHLSITSPKITITGNTFYKWYNELLETVEQIKNEVYAYHEGKYTAVETEDPAQLDLEKEAEKAEMEDINDVDFEDNKV